MTQVWDRSHQNELRIWLTCAGLDYSTGVAMRVELAHGMPGLAACCLPVLPRMLVCFLLSGWLSRPLLPAAVCLLTSISVQQGCLRPLLHQSDQTDCCGARRCLCRAGLDGCSWEPRSAVAAKGLVCADSAFLEVSSD